VLLGHGVFGHRITILSADPPSRRATRVSPGEPWPARGRLLAVADPSRPFLPHPPLIS
jgi:hypothetical protein